MNVPLSEDYVPLHVRRGSRNKNIWSDDNDDVELKSFTNRHRRRSRSSSQSFQENDITHMREHGISIDEPLADIGEEDRPSLDGLIERDVC